MGRGFSENRHISKKRLKDILKKRGTNQIQLADKLDRNKDNLNKQIRSEQMEVSLLEKISSELNVAVEYLTEEINETDSGKLYTHCTERDEDGYLIPPYEETLHRKLFTTVEDYFLEIGNNLLNLYKYLVSENYVDGTAPSLSTLHLDECDYMFDQLAIIKKLPMILQSIEKDREIKNHGKEK